MAQTLSHLPHLKNVQAGINKWDPMYSAIFEVYFTVPEAISNGEEEALLLTEQVKSVQGINDLNMTVGANQQKFLGVDVSYLNPVLDKTYAELTIVFNLNIRNNNDAYTFKVFKAWEKLGYDLATGQRTLKADYTADNLRIAEANRDGTIWRSYIFHDVFITEVSGMDELNYENKDARTLTVKFRADYWDEEIA